VLDDVDIRILSTLQRSGRTRRNELAEQCGLTLPAISERMRKLEERGYVKGYRAVLDAKLLGFDVTAFVVVSIDTSRHYEEFLRHVDESPDVLECHAITGQGSHLLKLRTRNTAALETALSKIQSWRGVLGTQTSVVLSSRKETAELSLTPSTP
jgi:Lrp/AsnC family leucine-responsive transcriptional regulator